MEIEEVEEDETEAKPHYFVKSLHIYGKSLSFMNPGTQGRDNFAKGEERFISKWDNNTTNKILFQSGKEEVRKYMDTVHNLHRDMKHLSASGNSTELIRTQRLMKMSMDYLQKEFHKILLCNSEPIHLDRGSSTRPLHSSTEHNTSGSNSPSSDRIFEFNMVPLDAVANLRSIAETMAKTGYRRE
ncbi:hypothetical protein KI387_006628 [Taxus chinensis]|uniref:Uncharacterized protein n=1 Tax=Taxus chinensis TaxID=29808 RepID=A0AA38LKZ9_TAXCH|nr:hypothetical protein KI387_006628 [Taxus chinensis]